MKGGEDLHHHHYHQNNFPFQLLEKKEDQETASCSTSSLYPSLRSSGSFMSVPSQLRSSYFNPNFSLQQHQRRTFFLSIARSSDNTNNNTSTLLNFQSNTLNTTMLQQQAKPELSNDGVPSCLDISDTIV
ncbi:hypothetical protein JHK87_024503 [Glycine soja]|nr:hypothetical protein JHK87_024503 [Glycine soja]